MPPWRYTTSEDDVIANLDTRAEIDFRPKVRPMLVCRRSTR
jgi:hypothetical protein